MTSKLTKSKIQVSGKIVINFPEREHNGLEINLNPLKQSKSGVYEILNKFNGKRYIGMSMNLENRKKHHWWDLEKGIHKSKEMQSDYEEFLKSNHLVFDPNDIFEFNVIIYCYPSELTFWEKILIDNLHPVYNTKKKKQIPPKVFDIDGNKIDKRLDVNWSGESIDFCDNDIEEEIM